MTITAAYPAMLPTLRETFTKANMDTLGAPFACNLADGLYKGNVSGRVIALWDGRASVGHAAVAFYLPAPNVSVFGWAYSNTLTAGQPSSLAVQDNSANPMAKGYCTSVAVGAVGAPMAVAAGTVWTSDTYRKAAWIPGSADAALATL